MTSQFDTSLFTRSFIGFDRLLSALELAARTNDAFPPYDIVRSGEDSYRIVMAVAGFGRDELEIETKEARLVVRGKLAKTEGEKELLHRGIARRPFERAFTLGDYVKVTGASLDHGLLTIQLVREIPESAKPRVIEIK